MRTIKYFILILLLALGTTLNNKAFSNVNLKAQLLDDIPFVELHLPKIPKVFIPIGYKKNKSILFKNSDFGFYLNKSSLTGKQILNNNSVVLKITIIDFNGNTFIINPSIAIDEHTESLLISGELSSDIGIGEATLILSLNDIDTEKSLINIIPTLADSFQLDGLFEPIINSIQALISTEKENFNKTILKIITSGENFPDRKINTDESIIMSKKGLIQIAIFPNNGLKKISSLLLGGNQVLVTKFESNIKSKKNKDKKIIVSTFTPFGQNVNLLTLPLCSGQCSEN